MEKFRWNDCVSKKELKRIKENKNVLHTMKRNKANGIG